MARKNLHEAKRWYQQAAYDLAAARWNFQGTFYNTTCFLAQQAAGKALKSVLYYLGARRQALLTHSVATIEVLKRSCRGGGQGAQPPAPSPTTPPPTPTAAFGCAKS